VAAKVAEIQAPPRVSAADAAVVAGAVALLELFTIWSDGTRAYPNGFPAALAGVALAIFAWFRAGPYAVHAALCFGLLEAWYLFGGPALWPLYLLVPLALYAMAVRTTPRLRESVTWPARGQIDGITVALMVLTSVVAGFTLWFWVHFAQPDVSAQLALVPHLPLPLLLLAGLGFAALNALLEEIVWRGVMLEVLDAALGAGALSIAIQAVSFGIAHLGGFPRGWLGAAMAATYGAMLGLIRRRTRGMLAPFITHIFADVVIFALLLSLRS